MTVETVDMIKAEINYLGYQSKCSIDYILANCYIAH